MNRKNLALMMSMIIGICTTISVTVLAVSIDGWQVSNEGWSYYEDNNAKIGWLRDNGNYYYLNSDGIMTTGWIDVNDNWYYMKPSGEMATGWQDINGKCYFMQESGEMKTGWLKYNGDWYYLGLNGAMVSDVNIDGYYLGKDGILNSENNSNQNNGENEKFKDLIMRTEKDVYDSGTKEIKINITNNGKSNTYYGLSYEVEKFENNKWIKVPFKEQQVFIEIAYNLEPGKTGSQTISLDNLEKLDAGKYRIVKFAGELTAEFIIK